MMRDLVRVAVVTAALAAPVLAFVPSSSPSRAARTRLSIHPPKNGIPGTWVQTFLVRISALSLFPFSHGTAARADGSLLIYFLLPPL